MPEGAGDGFPEQALGRYAGLHPDEGAVEPFHDRPALAGAAGRPEFGARPEFPQLRLDPIQMLELAEEPATQLRNRVPGVMDFGRAWA